MVFEKLPCVLVPGVLRHCRFLLTAAVFPESISHSQTNRGSEESTQLWRMGGPAKGLILDLGFVAEISPMQILLHSGEARVPRPHSTEVTNQNWAPQPRDQSFLLAPRFLVLPSIMYRGLGSDYCGLPVLASCRTNTGLKDKQLLTR